MSFFKALFFELVRIALVWILFLATFGFGLWAFIMIALHSPPIISITVVCVMGIIAAAFVSAVQKQHNNIHNDEE